MRVRIVYILLPAIKQFAPASAHAAIVQSAFFTYMDE